jgi:hypothetical protein
MWSSDKLIDNFYRYYSISNTWLSTADRQVLEVAWIMRNVHSEWFRL